MYCVCQRNFEDWISFVWKYNDHWLVTFSLCLLLKPYYYFLNDSPIQRQVECFYSHRHFFIRWRKHPQHLFHPLSLFGGLIYLKTFFSLPDVGTATQLELVQPLVPSAGASCCLLGVLGPMYTLGGIRALRASILQPSCSKDFIENRLDAVQNLVDNETGLMVDIQVL